MSILCKIIYIVSHNLVNRSTIFDLKFPVKSLLIYETSDKMIATN